MIPSQTEIRHFLELSMTLNFTRAAIGLGITQPSLTQSIVRLEEKLGTRLFHRTKQGCVPTPAAARFRERAKRLLECWDELRQATSGSERELSGVFRVGCHASVGTYALPGLIKRLAQSAPGVELALEHDWSRKITEKVVHYELDLGFVVNPIRHRDLVLKKLGSDRVGIWKAVPKPPERIFADFSSSEMRVLLGKLGIRRFDGWMLIESPSLEVIRALTLEGAGVGVIPERIARAGGGKLQELEVDLSLKDEIYLIHRFDTLKSVAGKAVLEAASVSL